MINQFELTFKTKVDKVMLDAGFIKHDMALAGVKDVNEFFVKAGFDGRLNPSLTAFFDLTNGGGKYLKAAVDYNLASGKNKVLLGFAMGYVMDNKFMGVNDKGSTFNGLYDGELSLRTSFKAGKHFVIEPMLAYHFPMSENAKQTLENLSLKNKANVLYGGLNIVFKF